MSIWSGPNPPEVVEKEMFCEECDSEQYVLEWEEGQVVFWECEGCGHGWSASFDSLTQDSVYEARAGK